MLWPTVISTPLSAGRPRLAKVAPEQTSCPLICAPSRFTSPLAVNPSFSSRLPSTASCAARNPGRWQPGIRSAGMEASARLTGSSNQQPSSSTGQGSRRRLQVQRPGNAGSRQAQRSRPFICRDLSQQMSQHIRADGPPWPPHLTTARIVGPLITVPQISQRTRRHRLAHALLRGRKLAACTHHPAPPSHQLQENGTTVVCLREPGLECPATAKDAAAPIWRANNGQAPAAQATLVRDAPVPPSQERIRQDKTVLFLFYEVQKSSARRWLSQPRACCRCRWPSCCGGHGRRDADLDGRHARAARPAVLAQEEREAPWRSQRPRGPRSTQK